MSDSKVMDKTPEQVSAELKERGLLDNSPERELIEKYANKLRDAKRAIRIKKRHWYVIIAWVTMVFNQLYAPAFNDWSVMANIGAAVLWPLYWFAFSAFGVAHAIHAWFI